MSGINEADHLGPDGMVLEHGSRHFMLDTHFTRLKVDDEALVFGTVLVLLERIGKSSISNDIRKVSLSRTVEILLENPLKVCCPSLVELCMVNRVIRGGRCPMILTQNEDASL